MCVCNGSAAYFWEFLLRLSSLLHAACTNSCGLPAFLAFIFASWLYFDISS